MSRIDDILAMQEVLKIELAKAMPEEREAVLKDLKKN